MVGIDSRQSEILVIGATGSIGNICSRMLAKSVNILPWWREMKLNLKSWLTVFIMKPAWLLGHQQLKAITSGGIVLAVSVPWIL